jgi:glycosyltransferase involved in cell wall biosynthesis
MHRDRADGAARASGGIDLMVTDATETLWIVMPAYNEATAIAATLRGLSNLAYRIVVVDDGSTDQTARRARACGATVVEHPINLGQGAALATGIRYALSRGATHICTFDADGQHAPETIEAMRIALRTSGAQVALGSRFLGATIGMPRSRRMLLKAAVAFTRVHARLPVSDTHNGLRLFTRAAAERIAIRQPRMAHGSEILSEIARAKLPFVEVPTTIRYTNYSRMKGQHFFDSIKIVLDLAYDSLTR